jgi:hypothetical protein
MNQSYAFITLLAVVLAGVIAASYSTTETIKANPYADRWILDRGTELPKLWLYYDTNDVNARQWADFGARSSNALNVPFLNLCYGSIVAVNGNLYDIQIIGGLAGVAERLGADALPPALHRQIERIGASELNWIRAAILAKFGGLWLDPVTICLKSFGKLPESKVVFFGADKDQTYAGPRGAASPSLHAIWSPAPGHPVFVAWADAAHRRLLQLHTGGEARQDAKWDYVSFAAEEPTVVVIPSAELSRNKRTGKRLQLEELLAAGQEGNLPFDVPGESVYVPFAWKELRDRRAFGWFLRMSEAQIMASDIAVRDLLMLTNRIPGGCPCKAACSCGM